jgi:hypothetical protein
MKPWVDIAESCGPVAMPQFSPAELRRSNGWANRPSKALFGNPKSFVAATDSGGDQRLKCETPGGPCGCPGALSGPIPYLEIGAQTWNVLRMPIRQDRTPAPVTTVLMDAFDRTISADRLKTYLIASGFKPEAAVALYRWNAAIGQSFHFPLQAVEVALRNVIHGTLTQEFGPDWWSDGNCRSVLNEKRTAEIDKAARRFRKKYQRTPVTGQIVASLTLGFWASMLHREYNSTLWDGHSSATFPHLQAPATIATVSRTATSIQDLRNRIFHQEPLIGHDLSADYAAILRMLGWICPETKEWVRHHSSVPIVIRQRPRA